MKKISLMLAMAVFLLNLSAVAFAVEVKDYSTTIKVFKDSPVVKKFFKTAYGYAVFPIIGKAGFVVGGSYGEGQVYRHNKVTGKSSVIKGSIGFQAGGEAISEIVFLKDKRAYDEFTSGNFEFDGTAQAVAITAGARLKPVLGASVPGLLLALRRACR